MSNYPHPATWRDLEWRRRECQSEKQWEREEDRQWKLHRAHCGSDQEHAYGTCLMEVVAATKAALKDVGLC
jgi:hypothetical protein